MSSKVALVGLTFFLATCNDDDLYDKNRPTTFLDPCEPDASKCKSPFSCLSSPALAGHDVCTLACTSDSDCPAWTATGHCAGPVQSRCSQAVCQYACK